jgi:hypothetical protein
MTTTPEYRPTDQFRDHLEWEVRRRFRRADRDRMVTATRRPRWAKAAAIVAVSASIGATAGFASAQIRQNAGRDSLLASARAEAMLAKLRADLARAQADDMALRVRMGAVDQQSVDAAAAELREMDARRNRAGLNIEEILAAGLPPRDDLGAPLVNNRDYVKLRLELDLMGADARLKEAEGRRAIAERRARMGALVDGNLQTADVDAAMAKAELSVLAEKLKLRADFLEHATPADELARRADAAQLRADASVAQAQLAAARERLVLVEKRRGLGVADDVELLRAQLAVKEQELVLQKIGIRLRTMK